MPIYEYRCDKGHNFEVMQRMSDDALTECSICGAPVQRVFHPVAIHFKGSGFYQTDYRSESYKSAAKADAPKAAETPKTDAAKPADTAGSSRAPSAKSESKSPKSKT